MTFYALTKPGARKMWDEVFAEHHYMSEVFRGHVSYVGILNDQPVVFMSCIFTASGTKTKDGEPVYPQGGYYREHRLVVLPDYQGLGIGVRASEWLGDVVLDQGYRYYSKTAHPTVGAYRDASPRWRATAHNRAVRKPEHKSGANGPPGLTGQARYSHEYIGGSAKALAGDPT